MNKRVLLSVILTISIITAFAEQKRLLPTYIDAGMGYIANPKQVFGEEQVDSVLFDFRDELGPVTVMVNRFNDSICYDVRENGRSVEKVVIDTCVLKPYAEISDSNAIYFRIETESPLFLNPHTPASYYDARLNRYPVMLRRADKYEANIDNLGNKIYVLLSESNPIRVFESGAFHEDAVKNGAMQKYAYSIGDTIHIADYAIRVDSIADDMIDYTYVTSDSSRVTIDNDVYAALKPYFGNRQYLLVDFWGTWCSNCIEAFPLLERIAQDYKQKLSFLSVCFDDTECEDAAQKMAAQHGMDSLLFIAFRSEQETLLRKLKVNVFPTVILLCGNTIEQTWTGRLEMDAIPVFLESLGD